MNRLSDAELIREIVRLECCSDPNERNEVALALSDTGDERVLAALVRLIQQPGLENQRGTLVYALREFDCSPHLELLVQLVVAGNFEVAHEAFDRLEEIQGPVENAQGAYTLLASANAREEWRQELIQDAEALFR